jgi:hypothetical protein
LDVSGFKNQSDVDSVSSAFNQSEQNRLLDMIVSGRLVHHERSELPSALVPGWNFFSNRRGQIMAHLHSTAPAGTSQVVTFPVLIDAGLIAAELREYWKFTPPVTSYGDYIIETVVTGSAELPRLRPTHDSDFDFGLDISIDPKSSDSHQNPDLVSVYLMIYQTSDSVSTFIRSVCLTQSSLDHSFSMSTPCEQCGLSTIRTESRLKRVDIFQTEDESLLCANCLVQLNVEEWSPFSDHSESNREGVNQLGWSFLASRVDCAPSMFVSANSNGSPFLYWAVSDNINSLHSHIAFAIFELPISIFTRSLSSESMSPVNCLSIGSVPCSFPAIVCLDSNGSNLWLQHDDLPILRQIVRPVMVPYLESAQSADPCRSAANHLLSVSCPLPILQSVGEIDGDHELDLSVAHQLHLLKLFPVAVQCLMEIWPENWLIQNQSTWRELKSARINMALNVSNLFACFQKYFDLSSLAECFQAEFDQVRQWIVSIVDSSVKFEQRDGGNSNEVVAVSDISDECKAFSSLLVNSLMVILREPLSQIKFPYLFTDKPYSALKLCCAEALCDRFRSFRNGLTPFPIDVFGRILDFDTVCRCMRQNVFRAVSPSFSNSPVVHNLAVAELDYFIECVANRTKVNYDGLTVAFLILSDALTAVSSSADWLDSWIFSEIKFQADDVQIAISSDPRLADVQLQCVKRIFEIALKLVRKCGPFLDFKLSSLALISTITRKMLKFCSTASQFIERRFDGVIQEVPLPDCVSECMQLLLRLCCDIDPHNSLNQDLPDAESPSLKVQQSLLLVLVALNSQAIRDQLDSKYLKLGTFSLKFLGLQESSDMNFESIKLSHSSLASELVWNRFESRLALQKLSVVSQQSNSSFWKASEKYGLHQFCCQHPWVSLYESCLFLTYIRVSDDWVNLSADETSVWLPDADGDVHSIWANAFEFAFRHGRTSIHSEFIDLSQKIDQLCPEVDISTIQQSAFTFQSDSEVGKLVSAFVAPLISRFEFLMRLLHPKLFTFSQDDIDHVLTQPFPIFGPPSGILKLDSIACLSHLGCLIQSFPSNQTLQQSLFGSVALKVRKMVVGNTILWHPRMFFRDWSNAILYACIRPSLPDIVWIETNLADDSASLTKCAMENSSATLARLNGSIDSSGFILANGRVPIQTLELVTVISSIQILSNHSIEMKPTNFSKWWNIVRELKFSLNRVLGLAEFQNSLFVSVLTSLVDIWDSILIRLISTPAGVVDLKGIAQFVDFQQQYFDPQSPSHDIHAKLIRDEAVDWLLDVAEAISCWISKNSIIGSDCGLFVSRLESCTPLASLWKQCLNSVFRTGTHSSNHEFAPCRLKQLQRALKIACESALPLCFKTQILRTIQDDLSGGPGGLATVDCQSAHQQLLVSLEQLLEDANLQCSAGLMDDAMDVTEPAIEAGQFSDNQSVKCGVILYDDAPRSASWYAAVDQHISCLRIMWTSSSQAQVLLRSCFEVLKSMISQSAPFNSRARAVLACFGSQCPTIYPGCPVRVVVSEQQVDSENVVRYGTVVREVDAYTLRIRLDAPSVGPDSDDPLLEIDASCSIVTSVARRAAAIWEFDDDSMTSPELLQGLDFWTQLQQLTEHQFACSSPLSWVALWILLVRRASNLPDTDEIRVELLRAFRETFQTQTCLHAAIASLVAFNREHMTSFLGFLKDINQLNKSESFVPYSFCELDLLDQRISGFQSRLHWLLSAGGAHSTPMFIRCIHELKKLRSPSVPQFTCETALHVSADSPEFILPSAEMQEYLSSHRIGVEQLSFVRRLVGLGFPESHARLALARTAGDSFAAHTRLVEQPEEFDSIDDRSSQFEWWRMLLRLIPSASDAIGSRSPSRALSGRGFPFPTDEPARVFSGRNRRTQNRDPAHVPTLQRSNALYQPSNPAYSPRNPVYEPTRPLNPARIPALHRSNALHELSNPAHSPRIPVYQPTRPFPSLFAPNAHAFADLDPDSPDIEPIQPPRYYIDADSLESEPIIQPPRHQSLMEHIVASTSAFDAELVPLLRTLPVHPEVNTEASIAPEVIPSSDRRPSTANESVHRESPQIHLATLKCRVSSLRLESIHSFTQCLTEIGIKVRRQNVNLDELQVTDFFVCFEKLYQVAHVDFDLTGALFYVAHQCMVVPVETASSPMIVVRPERDKATTCISNANHLLEFPDCPFRAMEIRLLTMPDAVLTDRQFQGIFDSKLIEPAVPIALRRQYIAARSWQGMADIALPEEIWSSIDCITESVDSASFSCTAQLTNAMLSPNADFGARSRFVSLNVGDSVAISAQWLMSRSCSLLETSSLFSASTDDVKYPSPSQNPPPTFGIVPGLMLRVVDTVDKICNAVVTEVKSLDGQLSIFIRYIGYSARWDEWISVQSDRIKCWLPAMACSSATQNVEELAKFVADLRRWPWISRSGHWYLILPDSPPSNFLPPPPILCTQIFPSIINSNEALLFDIIPAIESSLHYFKFADPDSGELLNTVKRPATFIPDIVGSKLVTTSSDFVLSASKSSVTQHILSNLGSRSKSESIVCGCVLELASEDSQFPDSALICTEPQLNGFESDYAPGFCVPGCAAFAWVPISALLQISTQQKSKADTAFTSMSDVVTLLDFDRIELRSLLSTVADQHIELNHSAIALLSQSVADTLLKLSWPDIVRSCVRNSINSSFGMLSVISEIPIAVDSLTSLRALSSTIHNGFGMFACHEFRDRVSRISNFLTGIASDVISDSSNAVQVKRKVSTANATSDLVSNYSEESEHRKRAKHDFVERKEEMEEKSDLVLSTVDRRVGRSSAMLADFKLQLAKYFEFDACFANHKSFDAERWRVNVKSGTQPQKIQVDSCFSSLGLHFEARSSEFFRVYADASCTNLLYDSRKSDYGCASSPMYSGGVLGRGGAHARCSVAPLWVPSTPIHAAVGVVSTIQTAIDNPESVLSSLNPSDSKLLDSLGVQKYLRSIHPKKRCVSAAALGITSKGVDVDFMTSSDNGELHVVTPAVIVPNPCWIVVTSFGSPSVFVGSGVRAFTVSPIADVDLSSMQLKIHTLVDMIVSITSTFVAARGAAEQDTLQHLIELALSAVSNIFKLTNLFTSSSASAGSEFLMQQSVDLLTSLFLALTAASIALFDPRHSASLACPPWILVAVKLLSPSELLGTHIVPACQSRLQRISSSNEDFHNISTFGKSLARCIVAALRLEMSISVAAVRFGWCGVPTTSSSRDSLYQPQTEGNMTPFIDMGVMTYKAVNACCRQTIPVDSEHAEASSNGLADRPLAELCQMLSFHESSDSKLGTSLWSLWVLSINMENALFSVIESGAVSSLENIAMMFALLDRWLASHETQRKFVFTVYTYDEDVQSTIAQALEWCSKSNAEIYAKIPRSCVPEIVKWLIAVRGGSPNLRDSICSAKIDRTSSVFN